MRIYCINIHGVHASYDGKANLQHTLIPSALQSSHSKKVVAQAAVGTGPDAEPKAVIRILSAVAGPGLRDSAKRVCSSTHRVSPSTPAALHAVICHLSGMRPDAGPASSELRPTASAQASGPRVHELQVVPATDQAIRAAQPRRPG
jgi:hypothetical protein